MSKFTIGDQVQILDNSNWHGLYAIVDFIDSDNIPVLYCLNRPNEFYYVWHGLEDSIILVDWK